MNMKIFPAKKNMNKHIVQTRKFASYVTPTNIEVKMGEDELIVSKTDLTGKITYANDTFLKMAKLTEEQAIGAPHSIIRHPKMPRAVFKLLWDRINNGLETFAYVLNFSSNGDHYWVFAHVTPTYNNVGKIIGFHSNRRKPDQKAIDQIIPIYETLLQIENNNPNPKAGIEQSFAALVKTLEDANTDYDRFIFSLAA